MADQRRSQTGGAVNTPGSLYGVPIIESPNVPAGTLLRIQLPGCAPAIYVRDAWADIRQPLMIGDMRHALRLHLDHVVRSAEQRLGLSITDRPGFVA